MAGSKKFNLGKCQYDPESRTISGEHKSPEVIGHVQAKLLETLISDPDSYFSNEQLTEAVWDNRYIENTTIRTTVSYLRKALGGSEECKYIDSGRNKGYRFVADIEEITSKRQIKKYLPIAIIICLFTSLLYILNFTEQPAIVPKNETTLLGQELEANLYEDSMIFSHKAKGSKYWNLYGKKLGNERYFSLTNGKFSDNNAIFSKTGKRIAFNRHEEKKCSLLIADFSSDNFQLSNIQNILNCPNEFSLTSIAWQDENNLLIAYTESYSKPFQIHSINIQTKKIIPISFPTPNGRGDYYVTKSSDSKYIAYLRTIADSITEIWIQEKITGDARKLASVPMVLMSAAWTDSGNSLVFRSGKGKLSKIKVEDGKIEHLFNANYTIQFPYRINTDTVGFMRNSLRTTDIIRLDLNNQSENIITSSFSDFSPLFAQNTGDMAFISDRTGVSQVWILKAEGELHQLTEFKESYRIVDLALSSNSKYISYTINTQLHVIDDDGNHVYSSDTNKLYSNPVFSKNGEFLFYSVNEGNEWKIESLSMKDRKSINAYSHGFFAIPLDSENHFYFMKKDELTVYESVEKEVRASDIKLNEMPVPNQVKIVGDFLYYVSWINNESILRRQNLKTQQTETILRLPTSSFSMNAATHNIYTHISKESETNLESVRYLF